jgi:hypothetical protein
VGTGPCRNPMSACAGISLTLGTPGAICDSARVTCVAVPAANGDDAFAILFCPGKLVLPPNAASPNTTPAAKIIEPVLGGPRRCICFRMKLLVYLDNLIAQIEKPGTADDGSVGQLSVGRSRG